VPVRSRLSALWRTLIRRDRAGGLARFGLGTSHDAVQVPGAYVSANFFEVLGVPMAQGRGFLAEDEHVESPNTVVVLSHRLWQTQFNGTPELASTLNRDRGGPASRLRARSIFVIAQVGLSVLLVVCAAAHALHSTCRRNRFEDGIPCRRH
jgi:hypothetical protein